MQDPNNAPKPETKEEETVMTFAEDAVAEASWSDRAKAAALLQTMPAWWRDRFVAISRQTGVSRGKLRRMTESLLRAYQTYMNQTIRTREAQARAKDERHAKMKDRIAKRLRRGGMGPIPGMSNDEFLRFSPEELKSDTHP